MTEAGERHASWLELFFDLCFVGAVAALAAHLHDAHSIAGLVAFALLFVPVWWAWMGYTWFSAAFDSTDVPHRLGLLAAMLAVTAVAAGVPGALGEGSSTTLVVAYTLLQAVLVALFVRAGLRAPEARPLTARYAAGNAIGAGLWLASLALTETARPWMWAGAMVVLLTTPVLAVRALAEQAYDPAHIPERYGLFTLIVLGESIVVVTAGLETGGGATPILAAVCGSPAGWPPT